MPGSERDRTTTGPVHWDQLRKSILNQADRITKAIRQAQDTINEYSPKVNQLAEKRTLNAVQSANLVGWKRSISLAEESLDKRKEELLGLRQQVLGFASLPIDVKTVLLKAVEYRPAKTGIEIKEEMAERKTLEKAQRKQESKLKDDLGSSLGDEAIKLRKRAAQFKSTFTEKSDAISIARESNRYADEHMLASNLYDQYSRLQKDIEKIIKNLSSAKIKNLAKQQELNEKLKNQNIQQKAKSQQDIADLEKKLQVVTSYIDRFNEEREELADLIQQTNIRDRVYGPDDVQDNYEDGFRRYTHGFEQSIQQSQALLRFFPFYGKSIQKFILSICTSIAEKKSAKAYENFKQSFISTMDTLGGEDFVGGFKFSGYLLDRDIRASLMALEQSIYDYGVFLANNKRILDVGVEVVDLSSEALSSKTKLDVNAPLADQITTAQNKIIEIIVKLVDRIPDSVSDLKNLVNDFLRRNHTANSSSVQDVEFFVSAKLLVKQLFNPFIVQSNIRVFGFGFDRSADLWDELGDKSVVDYFFTSVKQQVKAIVDDFSSKSVSLKQAKQKFKDVYDYLVLCKPSHNQYVEMQFSSSGDEWTPFQSNVSFDVIESDRVKKRRGVVYISASDWNSMLKTMLDQAYSGGLVTEKERQRFADLFPGNLIKKTTRRVKRKKGESYYKRTDAQDNAISQERLADTKEITQKKVKLYTGSKALQKIKSNLLNHAEQVFEFSRKWSEEGAFDLAHLTIEELLAESVKLINMYSSYKSLSTNHTDVVYQSIFSIFRRVLKSLELYAAKPSAALLKERIDLIACRILFAYLPEGKERQQLREKYKDPRQLQELYEAIKRILIEDGKADIVAQMDKQIELVKSGQLSDPTVEMLVDTLERTDFWSQSLTHTVMGAFKSHNKTAELLRGQLGTLIERCDGTSGVLNPLNYRGCWSKLFNHEMFANIVKCGSEEAQKLFAPLLNADTCAGIRTLNDAKQYILLIMRQMVAQKDHTEFVENVVKRIDSSLEDCVSTRELTADNLADKIKSAEERLNVIAVFSRIEGRIANMHKLLSTNIHEEQDTLQWLQNYESLISEHGQDFRYLAALGEKFKSKPPNAVTSAIQKLKDSASELTKQLSTFILNNVVPIFKNTLLQLLEEKISEAVLEEKLYPFFKLIKDISDDSKLDLLFGRVLQVLYPEDNTRSLIPIISDYFYTWCRKNHTGSEHVLALPTLGHMVISDVDTHVPVNARSLISDRQVNTLRQVAASQYWDIAVADSALTSDRADDRHSEFTDTLSQIVSQVAPTEIRSRGRRSRPTQRFEAPVVPQRQKVFMHNVQFLSSILARSYKASLNDWQKVNQIVDDLKDVCMSLEGHIEVKDGAHLLEVLSGVALQKPSLKRVSVVCVLLLRPGERLDENSNRTFFTNKDRLIREIKRVFGDFQTTCRSLSQKIADQKEKLEDSEYKNLEEAYTELWSLLEFNRVLVSSKNSLSLSKLLNIAISDIQNLIAESDKTICEHYSGAPGFYFYIVQKLKQVALTSGEALQNVCSQIKEFILRRLNYYSQKNDDLNTSDIQMFEKFFNVCDHNEKPEIQSMLKEIKLKLRSICQNTADNNVVHQGNILGLYQLLLKANMEREACMLVEKVFNHIFFSTKFNYRWNSFFFRLWSGEEKNSISEKLRELLIAHLSSASGIFVKSIVASLPSDMNSIPSYLQPVARQLVLKYALNQIDTYEDSVWPSHINVSSYLSYDESVDAKIDGSVLPADLVNHMKSIQNHSSWCFFFQELLLNAQNFPNDLVQELMTEGFCRTFGTIYWGSWLNAIKNAQVWLRYYDPKSKNITERHLALQHIMEHMGSEPEAIPSDTLPTIFGQNGLKRVFAHLESFVARSQNLTDEDSFSRLINLIKSYFSNLDDSNTGNEVLKILHKHDLDQLYFGRLQASTVSQLRYAAYVDNKPTYMNVYVLEKHLSENYLNLFVDIINREIKKFDIDNLRQQLLQNLKNLMDEYYFEQDAPYLSTHCYHLMLNHLSSQIEHDLNQVLNVVIENPSAKQLLSSDKSDQEKIDSLRTMLIDEYVRYSNTYNDELYRIVCDLKISAGESAENFVDIYSPADSDKKLWVGAISRLKQFINHYGITGIYHLEPMIAETLSRVTMWADFELLIPPGISEAFRQVALGHLNGFNTLILRLWSADDSNADELYNDILLSVENLLMSPAIDTLKIQSLQDFLSAVQAKTQDHFAEKQSPRALAKMKLLEKFIAQCLDSFVPSNSWKQIELVLMEKIKPLKIGNITVEQFMTFVSSLTQSELSLLLQAPVDSSLLACFYNLPAIHAFNDTKADTLRAALTAIVNTDEQQRHYSLEDVYQLTQFIQTAHVTQALATDASNSQAAKKIENALQSAQVVPSVVEQASSASKILNPEKFMQVLYHVYKTSRGVPHEKIGTLLTDFVVSRQGLFSDSDMWKLYEYAVKTKHASKGTFNAFKALIKGEQKAYWRFMDESVDWQRLFENNADNLQILKAHTGCSLEEVKQQIGDQKPIDYMTTALVANKKYGVYSTDFKDKGVDQEKTLLDLNVAQLIRICEGNKKIDFPPSMNMLLSISSWIENQSANGFTEYSKYAKQGIKELLKIWSRSNKANDRLWFSEKERSECQRWMKHHLRRLLEEYAKQTDEQTVEQREQSQFTDGVSADVESAAAQTAQQRGSIQTASFNAHSFDDSSSADLLDSARSAEVDGVSQVAAQESRIGQQPAVKEKDAEQQQSKQATVEFIESQRTELLRSLQTLETDRSLSISDIEKILARVKATYPDDNKLVEQVEAIERARLMDAAMLGVIKECALSAQAKHVAESSQAAQIVLKVNKSLSELSPLNKQEETTLAFREEQQKAQEAQQREARITLLVGQVEQAQQNFDEVQKRYQSVLGRLDTTGNILQSFNERVQLNSDDQADRNGLVEKLNDCTQVIAGLSAGLPEKGTDAFSDFLEQQGEHIPEMRETFVAAKECVGDVQEQLAALSQQFTATYTDYQAVSEWLNGNSDWKTPAILDFETAENNAREEYVSSCGEYITQGLLYVTEHANCFQGESVFTSNESLKKFISDVKIFLGLSDSAPELKIKLLEYIQQFKQSFTPSFTERFDLDLLKRFDGNLDSAELLRRLKVFFDDLLKHFYDHLSANFTASLTSRMGNLNTALEATKSSLNDNAKRYQHMLENARTVLFVEQSCVNQEDLTMLQMVEKQVRELAPIDAKTAKKLKELVTSLSTSGESYFESAKDALAELKEQDDPLFNHQIQIPLSNQITELTNRLRQAICREQETEVTECLGDLYRVIRLLQALKVDIKTDHLFEILKTAFIYFNRSNLSAQLAMKPGFNRLLEVASLVGVKDEHMASQLPHLTAWSEVASICATLDEKTFIDDNQSIKEDLNKIAESYSMLCRAWGACVFQNSPPDELVRGISKVSEIVLNNMSLRWIKFLPSDNIFRQCVQRFREFIQSLHVFCRKNNQLIPDNSDFFESINNTLNGVLSKQPLTQSQLVAEQRQARGVNDDRQIDGPSVLDDSNSSDSMSVFSQFSNKAPLNFEQIKGVMLAYNKPVFSSIFEHFTQEKDLYSHFISMTIADLQSQARRCYDNHQYHLPYQVPDNINLFEGIKNSNRRVKILISLYILAKCFLKRLDQGELQQVLNDLLTNTDLQNLIEQYKPNKYNVVVGSLRKLIPSSGQSPSGTPRGPGVFTAPPSSGAVNYDELTLNAERQAEWKELCNFILTNKVDLENTLLSSKPFQGSIKDYLNRTFGIPVEFIEANIPTDTKKYHTPEKQAGYVLERFMLSMKLDRPNFIQDMARGTFNLST